MVEVTDASVVVWLDEENGDNDDDDDNDNDGDVDDDDDDDNEVVVVFLCKTTGYRDEDDIYPQCCICF